MVIPRDHVVDFLRHHGQPEAADRALAELPEQVDVPEQAQLLESWGIDLDALLDHEPGHFRERTAPDGVQPY